MAEPNAPTIYHYHRDTNKFLGETLARLDPIEQKPLIPAYATTIAPPTIGGNEAAIFNPDAETWSIVADFVGQTWWAPDYQEMKIDELGVTPDPTWTPERPPTSIEDLRILGTRIVNIEAEKSRQNYITAGDGMSAVYQLKREEALKYVDSMNPTEVPLMNERATRLGVTLLEVQSEWLIKINDWTVAAVAIENLREQANEDIAAVPDSPDAEIQIFAIVEAVIWPT